MIGLLVLDLAGTTLDDGGAAHRVLADTIRAAGGHPTPEQLEAWMGASKREAIRGLLHQSRADASDAAVDAAFADFRNRLSAAYRDEQPTPFAGVTEALASLRHDGLKVALTTGFDREVTDSMLASVGWDTNVADAVVCVDDVPAGRPAPYLIFRAMEATGTHDIRRVLTAGDTVRDVEAGLNSGAQVVVAVTSGEVDAATLRAAGPTHVLCGVVEIPRLLIKLGQRVSELPVPA